LFRKFFYENSGFIEGEVKFLEITNADTASKLGLDSDDKIIVLQNKNPFSSFLEA